MFIPNVADNPAVRFFKRFPRIGSYFAAACQSLEGEYKALLCADTVVPNGSGKAFSQEDRDFIWDVSRAITKALMAREETRKADRQAKGYEEKFLAVAKMVTQTLYPHLLEAVEGEEAPPAAEAEGEEEVRAPPHVWLLGSKQGLGHPTVGEGMICIQGMIDAGFLFEGLFECGWYWHRLHGPADTR